MFEGYNNTKSAWLSPIKRKLLLDDEADRREFVPQRRRRELFGVGGIADSDSHREDGGPDLSSSGANRADRRTLASGASVRTVVSAPSDAKYKNRLEKAKTENMLIVAKPDPEPIGGSFIFEVGSYCHSFSAYLLSLHTGRSRGRPGTLTQLH